MQKVLFSTIILMLFCSCTTSGYLPVESVRVDSIFVCKVERDSIYERDSVFVAVKADTVFLTKVQYRYRDRCVRDTVSVLCCDTVTNVFQVEKSLTFWEHMKLLLGEIVMWGSPLLIGLMIIARKLF